MNKRGQALVTFVLVLPLIIFFAFFLIDTINTTMERNRIDGIISNNIESVLDKDIRDKEKIIDVIRNNDSTLNIVVEINNNELKVLVNTNKKSIFGNILKNNYNLEFNYCANYIDKKINKDCDR